LETLKHEFSVGDLVQLRFWNDVTWSWDIPDYPPYIVTGLGEIGDSFHRGDDPVGRAFITVVGGPLHDVRIIPSAYLVHYPKQDDVQMRMPEEVKE
jgi:hypothetical protein